VLALLLAELFVLASLVGFLGSPVLPRLFASDLSDQVAPRLEAGLRGENPDTGRLQRVVDNAAEDDILEAIGLGADEVPPGSSRSQQPDNDLTYGPGDRIFVVDSERRLLASNGEIKGNSRGEKFDASVFPGLKPLMKEALSGGGNPWRLGAYGGDWGPFSGNGGRMMLAAPVEGGNGQVLGAVVRVVRLPDLTAVILTITITGAIMLMFPAAIIGTVFGLYTAWRITRRLERLARAAQSWSRGDFSVVASDRSKDELGQLSRELNDMAVQLDNLMQARQELATLETRNRFARDLHDSVKQQVFATSLQIAAARNMISRNPDSAADHLGQADDLVRQAQRELNVLIHEMRPAALEDKGLAAALGEYAESWSKGSEIPTEVRVRGEREISLETEQALFRVAQEALANAARHSGAGKVGLDLIYTPNSVTLRITDDGTGFDPKQPPGNGFGLQSMQGRLAALGGSVSVESKPGEGTRVEGICPLEPAKGKQDKGER
jgi:signal transduction histidine kinase